jgi:mycothiol system anti-sigma-R factor
MARDLQCEYVLQRIYDYLDGEVDESTRADIDHHIEHCRECFGRAEFERLLKKRIADTASTVAPDGVRRRVKSLLKRF